MTVILVGASIPYEPLVRPLAMPAPLFFLQFGIQLLVTGWMSAARKPAPFRISSIPKGERMVPLVFTLVEDIVAVDGGAGKAYRTKLLARYRLSPRFRMLVAQINWFWGIGSFLVGSATLAVMWTVSEEIAYGIGKSIPVRLAYFFCLIPSAYRLECSAEFCDTLDCHYSSMGPTGPSDGEEIMEFKNKLMFTYITLCAMLPFSNIPASYQY